MASLDERVANLESLLHTIITSTNATRNSISVGFTKIDDNFQRLDAEISGLHNKIDQLSGNTDAHLDEVKMTLVSIKEEISKIDIVTNYDQLVSNMKLVNGGK